MPVNEFTALDAAVHAAVQANKIEINGAIKDLAKQLLAALADAFKSGQITVDQVVKLADVALTALGAPAIMVKLVDAALTWLIKFLLSKAGA